MKIDELIEEITVDADGDGEQLWAFRQAFEDNVPMPCEGAIAGGDAVTVLKIDFDGNERRGLTAKCRRPGGATHVLAAADIVFQPGTPGALYVAAYRKWIGLPATPKPRASASRRPAPAQPADVDGGAVDLIILSAGPKAARCRVPGSGATVRLRPRRPWGLVPGEIVTVKPVKRWTYRGTECLSGEIESTRLNVAVLGLTPLRLEDHGVWDPSEEYWGEPGEPLEDYARAIIAWGPRRQFEMEQVLPGADLDDFSDPIIDSNDLKASGDRPGASKILMELCGADLRCLDAHAHLGNLAFDFDPREAIRHYEVGVRIGELSLPPGFNDVLPWGMIDNRPFLRCLSGYGLCLWRLERFEEAERLYDRMLWLNPSDNQGVRCLIDEVRKKAPWKPDREDGQKSRARKQAVIN